MDAAWLLPDPDLETTTVENTTVTNANETDLILTPDSSAETAPDWTAASTNAPTKWSNDSKIHCYKMILDPEHLMRLLIYQCPN